ncbi:hypothetical protein [Bradyrhizobium sp. AZCC 2230]|uniref:hypothetical protein n=1 Tax=Bradyrhizobium sp. AZCC 2230 TaxID=3117021 RepID=UPI002FEF40BC
MVAYQVVFKIGDEELTERVSASSPELARLKEKPSQRGDGDCRAASAAFAQISWASSQISGRVTGCRLSTRRHTDGRSSGWRLAKAHYSNQSRDKRFFASGNLSLMQLIWCNNWRLLQLSGSSASDTSNRSKIRSRP